jgi:glutamate racemase
MILEPFAQRRDLDTLVLACTHFPLLRAELQGCLPAGVTLVDSGEAIARRVEYWLDTMALDKTAPPLGQHQCLFTRADAEIAQLQPALNAMGFTQVDYVTI